jgi:hypothetical protein
MERRHLIKGFLSFLGGGAVASFAWAKHRGCTEAEVIPDGAAVVGRQGEAVAEAIDGIERGRYWPSYHTTRQISGNLLTDGSPLDKQKYVMPNGDYTATRILRSRGLGTSYSDIVFKGQGISTRINHPANTGEGDQAFFDSFKRFYFGDMSMINDALPLSTSQSTSKNGQLWARYCEDGVFSNLWFSGGDVLTFCVEQGYNMMIDNIMIDWQKRFPVGYSKAPLIVSDDTKFARVVGGYVKALSRNGNKYTGDLAGNDYAKYTKWIGVNLLGLTYEQNPVGTACLWFEGEQGKSNGQVIGVSTSGQGYGIGVSQFSWANIVGCSISEAQVSGLWLRNNGNTILGSTFKDNLGLNTAVGNQNNKGAVYIDNAAFTGVIGNVFDNNVNDIVDYSGAPTRVTAGTVNSVANHHDSAFYVPGLGVSSLHHAVIGGRFSASDNAVFNVSGTASHSVLMGTTFAGEAIRFGYNSDASILHAYGLSAEAGSYTGPLMTQNQSGRMEFYQCRFSGYQSICLINGTTAPVFNGCMFVDCTFSAEDLSRSRFLNCRFINCTNSPEAVGYNFDATKDIYPISFGTSITATAGQSFSFPAGLAESRGRYRITIGGHRADARWGEYTVSKSNATSVGAVSVVAESNAGAFTLTWPADGLITIVFNFAGSYRISVS